MSKAEKKQRHRIRREAKRREARRRDSVSPTKRLARAPGETEYWMSDGFDMFQQTQIFVHKRAAGLSGIACFLVDRGVVGLKDAWTRMNVDHAEFQEMLDQSTSRDIPMRRATIEEVRRRIAGGIRWAHDNGMRLPKDWVKAAAFLGGINDWMTADVSEFTKEFAGHPEDLRQRLIGEPFEDYIRRSDIRFILSSAAPYDNQPSRRYISADDADFDEDDDDPDAEDEGEDGEPIREVVSEAQLAKVSERLTPISEALAIETSAWIKSRGQTPALHLKEAWRSLIVAGLIAHTVRQDSKVDAGNLGEGLIKELVGRMEASRAVEFQRAIEQAIAHNNSVPGTMQKAMRSHGSESK